MKRLTNNSMVAHVWAQQTQENGENSSGAFYFYGNTIFSFGSHFPIAKFYTSNVVLFNSHTYGARTSRHQALTRQAIPSFCSIITIPELNIRHYTHNEANHIKERYRKNHNTNLEYLKSKMVEYKLLAKRARKEYTITANLNSSEKYCNQYNEYLKVFKIRRKDLKLINDAMLERIINKRDKLRKKELIERKAKEKRIIIDNQIDINKWLSGESNRFPWDVSKVYLRINPSNTEEIQTSKNASFPISHGIRAYKLLKHYCVNNSDFQPIKIGYFRITSINKECSITAGCHVIEWDIIKTMGEKLLSAN